MRTQPVTPTWEKLVNGLLLLVSAGLIYVLFHKVGNTTEVGNYGRSAFVWMVDLWQASRIFGGSSNVVGWLIPFVTLGLILARSRELARVPKAVWWPGLGLVMFALFTHWAGARAQQTRLSLLALILLLWSIPLFLYGWQVAKRTAFPTFLLIFCVPLNFLDAFTFPMRIMATQIALLLVNGLGLAAVRAGSLILYPGDPASSFDGSDPASGLGILLLLTALGLITVSFLRMELWKKGVLIVLIPAAMILANATRLVILVILAAAAGHPAAMWTYSHVSSLLVLGLSGIYLASAGILLARIPRRRRTP